MYYSGSQLSKVVISECGLLGFRLGNHSLGVRARSNILSRNKAVTVGRGHRVNA